MVDTKLRRLDLVYRSIYPDYSPVSHEGAARKPLALRLGLLRQGLSAVRLCHSKARTCVLLAIEMFEAELRPSNVQFSRPRSKSGTWRKPSVLEAFVNLMGPALAMLLPKDDESEWESWKAAAILPLSDHVHGADDCARVSKALRRMYDDLDHAIEFGFVEETAQRVSLAEGLHALADAFHLVAEVGTVSRPRWCACCFRRAPNSSRYCNLHRPGLKVNSTDTLYRKSMRVRKSFDEEVELRWARHRAVRLALVARYPSLVHRNQTGLSIGVPNAVVSDVIGALATYSETPETWPTARLLWSDLMDRCFPRVAKQLGREVSQAESWQQFCNKLHMALDNRFEDTYSVLAILHLLDEAEDWYVVQQAARDGRLSDTNDRILSLVREGQKPAAISRLLGISRQYVYRVLADRRT